MNVHNAAIRSQEEFIALFENASMGIIIVNPAGEIVMINSFALEQFGYEKEEVTGRKIELLIPRRYRARHVQHRDNYHRHNPHNRPMGVGMDLSALRKDGSEFPVEVSLSNYSSREGTFSIAFISDITVRKASENALMQLNNELEQKVEERTQSLQEALEREKELGELKSRFVSMASHEFRTPLSTILSSTYLASKYRAAEDQHKRDKHHQRIISSVNMLTDILNDFLSVGKIEEGRIIVRPEPINLPSWLEGVIAELETVIKHAQQIKYVHDGAHEVVLDPSMLKHIVQNLVSNAIKFSPEGSPIILNTSRENDSFVLSVTDNGIGIPLEDQKHLFERFFRASNATLVQGTGLGLHIVEKYAGLMGGTVSFRSTPGHGTSFVVTFNLENTSHENRSIH